jgi:hypothetical protein
MHTCYSLCTNGVLNLGLANLNQPTEHFLSLKLHYVSSAEQMSKRDEFVKLGKYKYSPTTQLDVMVKSCADSGVSDHTVPGHRTIPPWSD